MRWTFLTQTLNVYGGLGREYLNISCSCSEISFISHESNVLLLLFLQRHLQILKTQTCDVSTQWFIYWLHNSQSTFHVFVPSSLCSALISKSASHLSGNKTLRFHGQQTGCVKRIHVNMCHSSSFLTRLIFKLLTLSLQVEDVLCPSF